MTNLVFPDFSNWHLAKVGQVIPPHTRVMYNSPSLGKNYSYFPAGLPVKCRVKPEDTVLTELPLAAPPQPWEVHIKDVTTTDGKHYAQLVRLDQSTFVNPYNSGERPLIDWIAEYTCVSTNQDAMVECDKRDRKVGSYGLEWLSEKGVWYCPDVAKYYDDLKSAGNGYGWANTKCFGGMRFADEG